MIYKAFRKIAVQANRLTALLILAALVVLAGSPQSVKAQKGSILPIDISALVLSENVENDEIRQFPKSNERDPRYSTWVVASAYSSDPYQTDSTPCIPAMGNFNLCENYELHGQEDTIASNCIPLGTQVKLPSLYGDRIFTVRDRMNERYGCDRVDVWIGSDGSFGGKNYREAKSKAKAFGLKRTKIEIFAKA